MGTGLIATTFLVISAALFWTAYRTPELRAITLGAGAIALILAGATAWRTWSQPPPAPRDTRGERLITIHGFAPPAVSRQVVAGDEAPEAMIVRMGCGVCHQIPGVDAARTGVEGPLLVPSVTARKRLDSAAYQRAREEGRATARTAREYVRESILAPNAFIVPGFEQPESPNVSAMPDHFRAAFTIAALEDLVDFLLAHDCDDAARDGLRGPRVEPIETLCGGGSP